MITVREKVEEIIKEQSLDRNRAFEVPYPKYKEILRKTVDTFICYLHYTKTPENILHWSNIEGRFKAELPYSFRHTDVLDCQYLSKVIPKSELVYVLIEDNSGNKFWVYEMYVNELITVLNELWVTDYYIVSQKFKWLITQDHHMNIHAVGEGINTAKI